MPVVGKWELYYYWIGNPGPYGNTEMTVNSNGTWTSAQSYTGLWVEVDGTILWQFDGSKVTYAGNIAGDAMVGAMSTFAGMNGYWYATKAGTAKLAKERKSEFDIAGNKV